MTRKKNEEIDELSEDKVWDVFNFARTAYQQYPNIFTPDLVNSRMKDINMNPLKGTASDIEKALIDPKNHEQQLVGYSEFFEYTDMIYKRLLNYTSLMPSFDESYVCTNISDEKDYNSRAYKKDLKIVEDFLDKFDHRAEFKKAMKMMVRDETYYCAFRDKGQRYFLQELPRNYCKITGRSEWGLLFDFNMYWFIQPAVSIDMYPDIFKKYYRQIWGGGNKTTSYNPAKGIDNRTGSYVYYVQTSMDDGMWAFKFNPEQAGNVPFLSPMFNDLVLSPVIRKLQTNKFTIEASKMLIGLVPLLKDNKSGNVKDMMGISPETLGKFLGLLRNSISEVYSMGAVPFEDVKAIDFDTTDRNMQESYYKHLTASSGYNNRIIYGSDRPNLLESQATLDVDKFLVKYLYPYFERFLEYNINKLTKQYKFKFFLSGTEFSHDKEAKMENFIKLANIGIVDDQLLANALGMSPHDLNRRLAMTRNKDFVSKLTPIMSSFQMSGKDAQAGRPTESTNSMTESGLATREAGSNEGKKV